MVVQHNLTAMNANRYLGMNNKKLQKSLEKLSSGFQINRAGDNAAGLAVSEKMRSQIAGMTQAVRNAQDGISMVQTFEGALTETDSILQRMKTLADQMANGTYDDPIDRVAAQQEFYQLSDEIDQIADTDFNGVVVLNGGRMADGLNAVDGEFDYKLRDEQLAAEYAELLEKAQKEAQDKINDAQSAYDKASAAEAAKKKAYEDAEKYLNSIPSDLTKTGAASVTGTGYSETQGSALFRAIQDPAAPGKSLEDSNYTKLGVTFEYKDGAWTVKSARATDSNNKTVTIGNDALPAGLTTSYNAAGTLKVSIGGTEVAEFSGIKDADLIEGDSVTLNFGSAFVTKSVPNANGTIGGASDGTGVTYRPTIVMSDYTLNAANLTEDFYKALSALKGAGIKFTYDNSGNCTAALTGINTNGLEKGFTVEKAAGGNDNDGKWVIKYGDDIVANIEGGPMTNRTDFLNGPDYWNSAYLGDKGKVTASGWGLAGSMPQVRFKFDGTNWRSVDNSGNYDNRNYVLAEDDITIYDTDDDTGPPSGYKPVEGDIVNITFFISGGSVLGGAANIIVAAKLTNKDFTFSNLQMTGLKYDITGSYNITKGTDPDMLDYDDALKDRNSKYEQWQKALKDLEDALKALEAAQKAYPNTIDDLDIYGVSKGNAFGKSEAKMTYTDHITLQVGARTKDAVDFTFQYASTAIGDLKADLNCSASGLGLDLIDITTQENANFAIDKIDQALNKVNLVRGTFGAIQNRLEHKIDNLNVSVENLTSAESQIRDTDMPSEMMNFTKNQILAQASQAMLAQANGIPQSVLSLLN